MKQEVSCIKDKRSLKQRAILVKADVAGLITTFPLKESLDIYKEKYKNPSKNV